MSKHSKRSIEQYYAEYPEHERLSSARGQLEFERTKRIVQRFLPSPPAIVADVGGGTGPYSFWLASLGYEIHLIEPSIRLVEVCRSQMQANPSQARPRTVKVGDARSLWLGDSSCDAVLMFGPLYHLTERDDRIGALRESPRSEGRWLCFRSNHHAGRFVHRRFMSRPARRLCFPVDSGGGHWDGTAQKPNKRNLVLY